MLVSSVGLSYDGAFSSLLMLFHFDARSLLLCWGPWVNYLRKMFRVRCPCLQMPQTLSLNRAVNALEFQICRIPGRRTSWNNFWEMEIFSQITFSQFLLLCRDEPVPPYCIYNAKVFQKKNLLISWLGLWFSAVALEQCGLRMNKQGYTWCWRLSHVLL